MQRGGRVRAVLFGLSVSIGMLAGAAGSMAQTNNTGQTGATGQTGNANQTGNAAQLPTDQFVDQVKAKMDKIETILTGDGFTRTHDRHYAKVKKDETEESVLTLNTGVEYAIVTVCDDDCTNVDAKLYGQANRELDMDTTGDDFPVLDIKPTQTGEYRIIVSVPGCSARRCTIGIGVYGKNGARSTTQ